MPDPTPTDDSKALAVTEQLEVVRNAVEVSLGVKELTTSFAKRKDELTTAAFAFTKPPETDEEQEIILSAQRDVAKLRTELTKNGDALKAPLNAAREKIIELVKTATAALKKAEDHCAGLINNRQQKLAAAREEARLAQEREAKRAAAEAAAAEQAAQDAERAREASALAESPEEQARLAAEASRLEDEAFARQLEAESIAVPSVPVSELPQAKEVVEFSIVGDNSLQQRASLIELLCAHPELFTAHCKTETPRSFSLTLKIADLQDRLNGRMTPAITAAPGITINRTLSKLR